jgi:transposase
MIDIAQIDRNKLHELDADQLRELTRTLLTRHDRDHEPENTTCACGCALKRIGEDVSEKLDYTPGVFSVERHIRGKWACAKCRTLTQAPVPAHRDRQGHPDGRTAGAGAGGEVPGPSAAVPAGRHLWPGGPGDCALDARAAWVGVCGVRLQPLADALKPGDLLARQVLHADETPVAMLAPGKGKTHRAYLWAYGTPSTTR